MKEGDYLANVQERLKALRSAAHMTQEELAAKLGVSKGTIGNYETGARTPGIEELEAIADVFNVDLDYLIGRSNTIPQFTLEEQWVIECYRNAEDDVKTAVKTILRKLGVKKDVPIEQKKLTKMIPMFGMAFAAGSGNYEGDSIGSALEEYEVPIDSKAEFAVRISGDSMEPELHDGDIALCTKRSPEIGEIIVCMVNGFFYVKQFITDGVNIYLRSINRKRKDADVDILNSGDYSFLCFGTVIHKKIPLVPQW